MGEGAEPGAQRTKAIVVHVDYYRGNEQNYCRHMYPFICHDFPVLPCQLPQDLLHPPALPALHLAKLSDILSANQFRRKRFQVDGIL